MIENRPLRVFLCHSSKDTAVARELYHHLEAEGWMDAWFIEARLLPSQSWGPEIQKGVENADVVIALLSKNCYTEEATDYPDWRFVSDFLQGRENKQVFVIPLLLDDTAIPGVLRTWQSIEYFPRIKRRTNYQNLLAILKTFAGQLRLSLGPKLPPAAGKRNAMDSLPVEAIGCRRL